MQPMCKWRSQDTERVPFRKDKYCEIEFLLLISFRFLLHFLFVRFVIAPVYSKTRAKSSHKKIGANQNGNDKMCSVAFNFGWFDLEISSNTRTNHITLFFLLFLSFYLFKRIQVFFCVFLLSLGILHWECVCRNAIACESIVKQFTNSLSNGKYVWYAIASNVEH